MSLTRNTVMRAGLAALHASGAAALMAPVARGRGVIFTLHSVTPEPPRDFEPNRILKITPEFLDVAIATARRRGYDIVSLDEAAERLKSPQAGRPFACFTLDDGYRDNRDHAYPVFKRHGVPFTIYVPTAYPDGAGELWWLVLEHAIAKADAVRVAIEGCELAFETRTTAQKYDAFYAIYWPLRAKPESELRAAVRAIAEQVGYDPSSLCRDLIMTWDEIRVLAADPLVTIGAHTVNHLAVAKLPEAEARAEIEGSVARIERELGRPCRHFSFPYGDAASAGPRDFAIARALGLDTAVTTQKNVVRTSSDLFSLPRISLNGAYQEARFVDVMMTGVPFMISDAATWAAGRLRPARRRARGDAAIAIAGRAISRPGAASI